jgi:hypothetical protein
MQARESDKGFFYPYFCPVCYHVLQPDSNDDPVARAYRIRVRNLCAEVLIVYRWPRPLSDSARIRGKKDLSLFPPAVTKLALQRRNIRL